MTKVIAVIGSGYGDEGKGLMTDYYSSLYDDAIVVRSNGGAQAGHTVTTPDGKRHVFSHFGSGSLNGTPTFLSSHFVCNPTLFKKEHEMFVEKFGITPTIYVEGGCLVSTPYDMLLNQTHESMRGEDVHGSCGVGFGETIERALVFDALYMTDISYFLENGQEAELEDTLRKIADDYVPTRIDLEEVGDDFKRVLDSEELIEDYIEACRYMLDHVNFKYIELFKDNTLVFEAAQGLLLDMDYGFFPHVTRSNCGMKNIKDIFGKIWEEHDVTVNYVTRAYTTRHGAGPLAREYMKIEKEHNIVDETNITNQFQGSLRFAPLDIATFNSVTEKDFLNYAPRGSKKVITMTCMDQLEGTVRIHTGDNYEAHGYNKNDFEDMMKKSTDFLSYGPTRETIIKNTT